MWIQALVTLFALAVVGRLIVNLRQRRSALGATLGWLAVWISIIIIFWSPEIASRLARYAGIGRGADLIVYGSIIVILYLLYRIFARLERMKRDMTTITRELALKHGAKEDPRRDPDSKL